MYLSLIHISKTDKTADRRHDVARRLYILGKSTILDLSLIHILLGSYRLPQFLYIALNQPKQKNTPVRFSVMKIR